MSVGRANINSIYLNCTLKTLFACIIKVERNGGLRSCLITYSVDMLIFLLLLLIVKKLHKRSLANCVEGDAEEKR